MKLQLGILLTISFIFCLSAAAQERVKSEESLFLDLHKLGLGTVSEFEEKKKYLETVQLEKQKVQMKLLRVVYENAFDYYRKGDYESAKELATRILSIDPNFQDASMLLNASNQLEGSLRPVLSEKIMLEDRFKESLNLYNENRIVEAYKKMEEVVKLAPNNIKAKYWLGKMREELKEYYFNKGREAHSGHDLKAALDNYYNALLIKPRDVRILDVITRTENEYRQEQANERLKTALESYSQGKLLEAHDGLKKVIEIQPADSRANNLLYEVRGEIEQGFITRGRKFYGDRKYTDAISEWQKAKPYSANLAYVDRLILRAKEQMKLEAQEKKRRAEEAAKRAKEEEEERKRQEEERKKLKAKHGTNLASETTTATEMKAPPHVSEEHKMAAQQHYIEGLKYFQNSNFEKARDEWTITRQLDPGHADAEAGLRRIEQILSGGQ